MVAGRWMLGAANTRPPIGSRTKVSGLHGNPVFPVPPVSLPLTIDHQIRNRRSRAIGRSGSSRLGGDGRSNWLMHSGGRLYSPGIGRLHGDRDEVLTLGLQRSGMLPQLSVDRLAVALVIPEVRASFLDRTEKRIECIDAGFGLIGGVTVFD